jgi:hypothetical protein
VHPAVAALSMEERGYILGTLLAGRGAGPAGLAAGPRCQAALGVLAAQPRSLRAAALADLIALLRAPVPAGIERVHPGWLRERLEREPSPVLRAITDELPVEVRRVTAEILTSRGEPGGGPPLAHPPGRVIELRRAVFGDLVPLTGPAGPSGPEAQGLMELSFAAVEEAIEMRGAATMGASLRGAPAPVVAQAAAGLGGRLGRALLEAARQAGPPEERDRARLLVSAAAGEDWASLAMRLGLRALAVALTAEGGDGAAAVGQRLPPALGRRLMALAAAPWG